MISRKPKVLLGSEMIFEIATALQDILDQGSDDSIPKPIANEIIDGEIPNLHQERARQEAEANQRAKDAEEEKLQTQKETEEERQRQLAYMINQEKARMSHRRNKQPATADLFEIEELVSGGLRFDQPVHLTDSKGNVDMFHTVHQKIGYKQGPVTRIYTVQPLGSRAEFSPFLALKECHVPISNNETFMKRLIQELESTLDRFKSLVSHPNVEKPLNFNIQRTLATELSNSKGWDVNILTMLKDKGSVRELLDTIGTINIEMIRAWAIQLLEGLDFYHRNGMVHSDIHVGNILLEKAETGNTVVKLSDGGYQYQLHSISCCLNAKCSLHGLDLWSAPERSESPNGNPTAATDIWDLGVTLLQMIFGLRIRNKQVSPNGFLTSKDVSRSLEDFFHNMLAIDSKKRKSAFDLKRFEFFRTGETVFREPSSPNVNSENFTTSFVVSSVAHPRRESVLNPPKPSRYINDFEEIGLLGRGGFGEVVKARHKLENQFYAIKKIRQNSATALNKVLSEIVMLSQLSHPNVVRYFTAWTENDELHWPGGAFSSSSNGSVVSIIDENPDDIFTRGSGGLDFIGADPPDIVFGYDSDNEGGESITIHKSENDKENDEESEVESELWSEQDPQEGSDDEANNNSIPLRRRHSSSHESATGTTLYIQMQYCERKVSYFLLGNEST